MHSEGTARLLKRFRSYIKVSIIHGYSREARQMEREANKQSDFVLLPCDLAPPKSLKLMSILDKHRQSPTAVLTSVFYEPVESVKEGMSLPHCHMLADE
jgi:translation initiation factor eIF-2B subunit gamma